LNNDNGAADGVTKQANSKENLYRYSWTVAYLSDVHAGMAVALDSVLHEKALLLVLVIRVLQTNHLLVQHVHVSHSRLVVVK